jgi:hypothetical protein
MGIVLIIVAVRYFGRVIGVTKVYPVGMLRYFVVLGSLSVIMGLSLVLSEAPAKLPEDTSELLNSQTEKWQAVKDANAFCAKEGKEMPLQKLDRINLSATKSSGIRVSWMSIQLY